MRATPPLAAALLCRRDSLHARTSRAADGGAVACAMVQASAADEGGGTPLLRARAADEGGVSLLRLHAFPSPSSIPHSTSLKTLSKNRAASWLEMSVSATSVGGGSEGSSKPPSSSSITATAATGQHLLKIDSYSLTKAVPCGGHIRSSNFQAAGHDWHINFFPNCGRPGRLIQRARGYVSLQLVLDSAVSKPVKAQFTVCLLDHAGKPAPGTSRKSPIVKNLKGGWWLFKFIKEEDLEKPVSGLLREDGSFTLQCDVVVFDGFRAVKAAPFVAVPPSDMHRHFGELLSSEVCADVTLEAGGWRFEAHRCVLAARSPVFKAKLLGPMKEGAGSSAIHIEDIEPRVLRGVLQFMYTDTVPEMSKEEEAAMSQHLLEAADRFNLQRLKLICEDKLCGCIDTSSVVNTLALAEQHNCQGLKEKCFEFLKATNLNAAMATDGFNHLASSCPTVLEELMSKLTLH
ncbi:hypothetical protein EJB05_55455, partial [Eragrostis curvula]